MTEVPGRILVVSPRPLGDAVMATPAFRALRRCFPRAHVTLLRRAGLAGLVDDTGWFDDVFDWTSFAAGVSRLRRDHFDLAVLFPNSLKSALLTWLGRVGRRAGYVRDARGWLLTDKLHPPRRAGKFVPLPMIDYYLALAGFLGADVRDRRMELSVSETEDCAGRDLLGRLGLADGRPVVLFSPGAAFGPSKCWPTGHFARLADLLVEREHVHVAVLATPEESPLAQAIRTGAKSTVVNLATEKIGLGTVKAVVRRARLLVTNDTGPRHVAAALDTPVVTLFGPTDQRWTRIDFPKEIALHVPTECGPCQRPTCPHDHRCMEAITPEQVFDAAHTLLTSAAGN